MFLISNVRPEDLRLGHNTEAGDTDKHASDQWSVVTTSSSLDHHNLTRRSTQWMNDEEMYNFMLGLQNEPHPSDEDAGNNLTTPDRPSLQNFLDGDCEVGMQCLAQCVPPPRDDTAISTGDKKKLNAFEGSRRKRDIHPSANKSSKLKSDFQPLRKTRQSNDFTIQSKLEQDFHKLRYQFNLLGAASSVLSPNDLKENPKELVIPKHADRRQRREAISRHVRSLSLKDSTSEGPFICKCDSICVEYGDCCVDTLIYCFDLLEKEDDIIEDFFINHSRSGKHRDFGRTSLREALSTSLNYKELENIKDAFVIPYGSCVKVGESKGVRVISRCPSGFDNRTLIEACQSGQMPLLPIVSAEVSSKFYFSFRNIHCAICHGMKKVDLARWETSISCKSDIDSLTRQSDNNPLSFDRLRSLVLDGLCEVRFKKPYGVNPLRECQPGYDLTSELDADMDEAIDKGGCSRADAMLCMAYIVPYEGFRNPHCEYCYMKLRQNKRVRRSEPFIGCKSPDFGGGNLRPGGVLILLDITGTYTQLNQGASGSHDMAAYLCRDDQLFDPFLQTCEGITCSKGTEPFRGVCVTTSGVYVPASSQLYPDRWSNVKVTVTLSQESDAELFDCPRLVNLLHNIKKIQELLLETKNITIHSYVNKSTINKEDGSHGENETGIECVHRYFYSQSDEKIHKVTFSVLAPKQASVEKMFAEIDIEIDILLAITRLGLSLDVSVMESSNKASSSSSTCSEDQVIVSVDDFTIRLHKGIEYAAVNASGVQFNFPFKSIGFNKTVRYFSGEEVPVESLLSVSLCLKTDIFAWENCSVTSYRRNETRFVEDDRKLRILRSGREFGRHLVYDMGDELLVCDHLDFIDPPAEFRLSYDEVYTKLNWICSCVSILFLALMLLAYWVFPELLTLPGRLIACLAATMMLTFALNLLTLVDLRHDILCPFAAVFAHFVTLAHYGWMSAIAVNMALTFGGSSVKCQSDEEGKRMFVRYNIIVWGLSAFVVAVSLSLDLTHADPEYVYPPGVLTVDSSPSAQSPFTTSLPLDGTESFGQDEMMTRQPPSEFTTSWDNEALHNENIDPSPAAAVGGKRDLDVVDLGLTATPDESSSTEGNGPDLSMEDLRPASSANENTMAQDGGPDLDMVDLRSTASTDETFDDVGDMSDQEKVELTTITTIKTSSAVGDGSYQFPIYGYPFCSWFFAPLWAKLAFVLVPYGVTFVIDIIGFAITIRGIIVSVRASAKTLAKQIQHRAQCLIFLKLSTTMGISWAISVFFTVSESRVLVYVYTTMVLLQGMLLFLAFMVNKRVLSLVKKRFSCPQTKYGLKTSGDSPKGSRETQSTQFTSSSQ